jgi:hypothetical protein
MSSHSDDEACTEVRLPAPAAARPGARLARDQRGCADGRFEGGDPWNAASYVLSLTGLQLSPPPLRFSLYFVLDFVLPRVPGRRDGCILLWCRRVDTSTSFPSMSSWSVAAGRASGCELALPAG